uniref:Mucin-5AC-like n=1 Tax=Dermatophagoides pteronyssinus TaxID=6956 RepID=A0A6P6YD55_DERPT|nr:mucin-5AC-like [Dermatophagoides pteronyssinus]
MDDGGRCLLDVINDPQLLQSFLENNSNNNNTAQQQTNSNSLSTTSTSNVVVVSSASAAAVASNATIISAPSIVQPPPPSLSTTSSSSIIINQNKNDSVFNTATTIDQLSAPSLSSMVAATTTQPIIVPNNNNNNGIINPIITIPKTLASQILVANNNNQLMASNIAATTTTTTPTTNKPVRARKSTAVATKSNSNSSSKSMKNQQMTNLTPSTTPTSISSISGILGSSNIATSIASNTLVAATPTFLNSTTGLIPITSLATTGVGGGGGLQGLIFAGSHLTHTNATSNVQSIRHPSTFVSSPQFQLGPRPPMTVLPQPFILPGGLQLATNGSNNQQQFVFARPSLTHQQHQTTGPQLLQIIQTSQGPQLIAQAPSTAPIQTIATSNHIQTINVQQQQQQQTSTVLTPTTTSAAIITKNSKGSNKQILPKPNSAKNSKTNHQQNQNQNQNLNNSQNIKFIQAPAIGGTTNPFSTSTNPNATQFLIGGGGVSGGIHQNHQPQLIAGPNGTFFLSNNNILHTNTGGPTQFTQQPQFLLQNQQLLAIRPSAGTGSLAGQTFLVNPNALTTAANNLNNNNNNNDQLNQLTIPQSSSIINTNKSSNITHATSLNHILLNQNTNTTPIVSQASQGLTAFRHTGHHQQQQAPGNLIIRPQIIGQQPLPPTSLSSSTTTTVNNNSTPQLIQIQTPNGPILLSVNLNSSQQQQQPSQPQIQQPPAPQPSPQTIQIDNTLYSLTTNPVNQQQPTTLNLGGGGGGAATLSQTILTNQTHNQQQQQLLTHHHQQQNFSSNQQLHQQQTILSSSNNNQKNQTTTITKPKTQNPTKGLNLADLLKETGILTEFSPPTSPISITQTKDNNNSANVLIDPLTRISTPSSQSQTILMVSNSNNNLSTTATTTNAVAAAANTALAPSSLQSQTQQLRISLTPDGTIVLLSPNSNTLLPTIQQQQQQGINNLTATTIIGQTKNTNSKQQQQQTVVNDSSGLGSSQPSPDSTTPSIDTGSCSSPSTVVTTPQSLSTQTIKNINSIDSKTLDNNTVDDTVVSSLSSTNQSSLKTLTSSSSSSSTTTTTTCTADTSSINQSIKPSHLMNNTSLVLSQQPTLPLMTNNQTTTTTTYTTILIPGTIMFLNDKRIPIATLNRTNQINELMQRLDNHIKQNILQQQPKDLQQELQQLQQTLLLIQSQPIIPSQIPQVKISDKIAQLLQVSTWATQSTQIKTSPQTIAAVVNHHQSSIGTTLTTTTTTTTTTTSITTPTTVKFVLGPKINSNSLQLVHSIQNSSPIIPLSSSSSLSLPSTTAKQATTVTATDSIQSPDIKTQITTSPSPVITTPIIVKQEKPKSNILKAIQSQLHADQNTALHPDCRTPFRSRDDACKRLLRYHVFDQQQFSEKQLQKFDELFEQASQTLLYKRQQLYDKFRYLIIKDSMKYSPSCEQVMVNRIIIDEENAALKSDKELVASGGMLDLPPLPETWLEDSLQQQQDNHKNDEENIRQKHSLFDTDELMNVDYFDNITLKRKFEEDNSAADFLLESATTTTTNLFTTTSSELNSDLNALCDIFDEESIANPTSIKNDDDNDDVDKLIKLHSPIDTNNDSDFLGIDGLNDHNNADDDDNDSLLRCNNQNFDDSNRAITDVDDDLEALYSNITDTSDLIGNNQNSLLWPNDSNHNHHHMLNSTTDSLSLSHNHHHHHRNQDHFLGRSISTGGGGSGGGQSSLSWSTRSYGNVNETEAAVAVQSIIGGNDDNDIPTEDHNNDGTMDFSSLELSDNVHGGDTTTATSNNHFDNEDLFPNDHQSFDDNVRESSTAIDTTNFIQNSMTNNNNNTSAADMQMNCAIKSIMIASDSYHINNDNMSSSSTSSLNNELSYQHQNHHHHQQQTSMMLTTSTISTSTNMMNRFSSSNNSMMMMNSFSVPSTMSHVNDPMLDEAVKSIL